MSVVLLIFSCVEHVNHSKVQEEYIFTFLKSSMEAAKEKLSSFTSRKLRMGITETQ